MGVTPPPLNPSLALDAAIGELVEGVLVDGKTVRFTVVSLSMWPWLAIGSRVNVQRCDIGDLRIGAVVVVKRNDASFYVHRLVRIVRQSDTFHGFTKGDNASLLDPPVMPAAIQGIVISVVRGNRYFNLRSSSARLAGGLIARISLLEVLATGRRHSTVERLVLRVTRRLVRFIFWMVKFSSSTVALA